VVAAGLATAVATLPSHADTPGEEDVCAVLTGAAWGLCDAYCNAMDCDGVAPEGTGSACQDVLDHFADVTDGALPACIDADGDGVIDSEQG